MNEVQDFVKNFANAEGQNKEINNFFSSKVEHISIQVSFRIYNLIV